MQDNEIFQRILEMHPSLLKVIQIDLHDFLSLPSLMVGAIVLWSSLSPPSAGQEPPVEVRQQDEQGSVHRIEGGHESWSEAAQEAQAQASRAQLMRNAAAQRAQVGYWQHSISTGNESSSMHP